MKRPARFALTVFALAVWHICFPVGSATPAPVTVYINNTGDLVGCGEWFIPFDGAEEVSAEQLAQVGLIEITGFTYPSPGGTNVDQLWVMIAYDDSIYSTEYQVISGCTSGCDISGLDWYPTTGPLVYTTAARELAGNSARGLWLDVLGNCNLTYNISNITITFYGITVTPTSGLITTEGGGTDTFTVVLDVPPTDDVTIDLSSSDTNEGTVSPSTLTFTPANWDVPQLVTVTGVDDNRLDDNQAYTIVTSAAASMDAIYDGVDPADVSVTNLPVILTAPNGGEFIPSGSIYPIQWVAPPEAVTFKLKCSLNNGGTWKLIESGITDTSYDWTVPTPRKNKKKCLVKVIGYDDLDAKVWADRSDATFTIEVVEVTSPNGGEILTPGSTHSIEWTANETKRPVAKVKLLYTNNGGSTWNKIETLEGAPGFYDWAVPDVLKTKSKCRVKVVLKDAKGNKVGSDKSDDDFTIQP